MSEKNLDAMVVAAITKDHRLASLGMAACPRLIEKGDKTASTASVVDVLDLWALEEMDSLSYACTSHQEARKGRNCSHSVQRPL